ncbi:Protein of unknown function [Aeromonas sp. RU39B]|uniref:DUF3142 domain-containing protein n=1 Tax=Aeromonas sp. RU39B TaxID=1907416 RepID=UPI0009541C83|nr:DUF3142 domain-containing protein [Aeromonas sp. RU39B]SIP90476.1 Protein of unknown function [Aeromonas sp. RU39B]
MMHRFSRAVLLLGAALALPAYGDAPVRVDASRYQAFWLWSGTRPQPVLSGADTLYLQQGEILARPAGPRFYPLGRQPSRLPVNRLWLVVRVNLLPLTAIHHTRLAHLCQRWRAAGNPRVGIQIDFDAATRRLADYADNLTRIRQQLPTWCGLSVTGLLDWASQGDVTVLNRLPVDELVIQTYQGRHSVPDVERYLPALLKLTRPFRIGLVQDGQWDMAWEQALARSPWYRGAVVFLLNPRQGK